MLQSSQALLPRIPFKSVVSFALLAQTSILPAQNPVSSQGPVKLFDNSIIATVAISDNTSATGPEILHRPNLEPQDIIVLPASSSKEVDLLLAIRHLAIVYTIGGQILDRSMAIRVPNGVSRSLEANETIKAMRVLERLRGMPRRNLERVGNVRYTEVRINKGFYLGKLRAAARSAK